MARLIYQQDSTPQHKRMARRHIRLCGQINGAAPYGQAMQEKLDALIGKENERVASEEQCENALDDIVMKDQLLDNKVRNLFEHARRYDRDNLTQFTAMLFPNNTFTEFINLPATEEPLKVLQLIEKLENLEEGHELLQNHEGLSDAAGAVIDAQDARREAIGTLRRRQASEELARNDVRVQYENNYLDARKNFGKMKAEMLFPKIAHRSSKPVKDPNETVTEE